MFKKIRDNLIVSIIVALIVIGFIVGIGAAVSGGGVFTAGNINKGLVGYWPLDGSGGGAEATVNLAPHPYYSDGTVGNYYDAVNGGWGSTTRLKIENVTGPEGTVVKAFTEELLSYTVSPHMEGGQYQISGGGNNTLTLTAGQTYVISVYVKANANDSSSNMLYLIGASGNQSSSTMSVTTEWTRISRTFTPTTTGDHNIRSYFYNAAVGFKIYYTGLQVELKDHITPFVNGTRYDRAADNSPNNNNGDIHGADVRNHGYSFDANGEYIDTGNISLDAAGEMTLSFWVKPEASASGHEIAVGNADNNCLTGFSFSHYSSGFWYFYHANDTWSLWSVVPTEYQHVVLQIKKGDYKKAYRNGVLYNTNSSIGTQSLDSGNFIIGNGGGLVSSNSFRGNIADVRLYNYILTADQISDLYNGKDVGSPIGHWKLDNGSKDISGNNNHGTVTGATLIGEAGYFDGTNDYIDTSFDGTDEDVLSFAFWAKANDITTASAKYIVDNSLGATGYIIRIDTGTMTAYNYYTSSSLQSRAMAVPDTGWHFWVARFTNTSVDLSLDGGAFSSTTFSNDTFRISADTMTIGSDIAYGDNFPGYISDLRVYNRVISQDDVYSLYDKGREGRAVTQVSTRSKGLVGHWELNQEGENVGVDLTVNPNLDSSGSSWSSFQMTRTWDASYGWNGGGLKYDWDNTSHGVIETSYVATTAGKRYVMSMKFKADANNDFDYSSSSAFSIFGFKTGGSTERGTDYSSIEITSLGDGWYQWTRQFTANTTSASAGLIYAYKPGTSIPRSVYVDDGFVREVLVGDSTPAGNNGSIYGVSYTTDRKGQSNGAMSFDGSEDYILVPDDNNLDLNSEFTVSAFIKRGAVGTGNRGAIMAKRYDNTSGYENFALIIENTDLPGLYMSSDGSSWGTSITSDTSITDTTSWHHLLAMHDGATAYLYLDGVLVGSDTTPITATNSSEPFMIGTRRAGDGSTTYNWNGSIQDVRIYDRALSKAEIQGLYESYQPKITAGSLYKGLVGSWSLKSKDEKLGAVIESDTFEAGTEGWGKFDYSGSSTVQTRDDTVYKNGSYSLKSVVTAGTSNYPSIRDSFAALTEGKTYRASMWVKIDSSKSTSFRINTAGGLDGTSAVSSVLNATTEWQHVNYSFVANGSNYIFGGIRYNSGSLGDAIFWIDDWKIQEVNTADTTPYANHGVVYGATVGENYSTFNGSSNYIVTSKDNIEDTFTLSAWINGDSSFDGIIFGRLNSTWSSSSVGDFHFSASTSAWGLYGFLGSGVNGGANSFLISDSLSANTWYNLVATYDGTTIKYYKDGVYMNDDKTMAFSDDASSLNIWIGARQYSGSMALFEGDIANAKIFNRALSADEVTSLYNQGR
ncbi:MAG: LamG-like jellyroll fold domain-containing protein [Candidatus Komeilibacteria bacterium]